MATHELKAADLVVDQWNTMEVDIPINTRVTLKDMKGGKRLGFKMPSSGVLYIAYEDGGSNLLPADSVDFDPIAWQTI